ncbi:hypothetical protein [[Eubacterium] cellulosolvens]
MDYFWLLAGVSAGFGALSTGILLRKVDISHMSYREARQLLSAMVCSLSTRIQQNEVLTKELSEQVQILNANQAQVRAEAGSQGNGRILECMHDWIGNVRRLVDTVDTLQKNLKKVEEELQEMRVHVDRLSRSEESHSGGEVVPVGVVTQDVLGRLSPTERRVLELLVDRPKAGPEIGRLIMKSREHTARLMKSLFEQGFVERETHHQPYEYRLNDKVRDVVAERLVQQFTGS